MNMQGSKSTYSQDHARTFLKRLKGCDGNSKLACQSLGMSQSTPHKWASLHPEFAEKFKEVRAGK